MDAKIRKKNETTKNFIEKDAPWHLFRVSIECLAYCFSPREREP